jgi:hypothetical protein
MSRKLYSKEYKVNHKPKLYTETRIQLLIALGPLAGLAFILSIFINSLENPDMDLLSGFLTGFSITGNLVYIYVTTRYLRNKKNLIIER